MLSTRPTPCCSADLIRILETEPHHTTWAPAGADSEQWGQTSRIRRGCCRSKARFPSNSNQHPKSRCGEPDFRLSVSLPHRFTNPWRVDVFFTHALVVDLDGLGLLRRHHRCLDNGQARPHKAAHPLRRWLCASGHRVAVGVSASHRRVSLPHHARQFHSLR